MIQQEQPYESTYHCWLNFEANRGHGTRALYRKYCEVIVCHYEDKIIKTAVGELSRAIHLLYGEAPKIKDEVDHMPNIKLEVNKEAVEEEEGFMIRLEMRTLVIRGRSTKGILYGVFYLLRAMARGENILKKEVKEAPYNKLRLIHQWDHITGNLEGGIAGESIFYTDGKLQKYSSRLKDYARLLASIGINGLVINYAALDQKETGFVTESYLNDMAHIAQVFGEYGIKLYLSINFIVPTELGTLVVNHPVNCKAKAWWKQAVEKVYMFIPNLGGFVVKADLENRLDSFSYVRDHTKAANMLGEALEPFGGIVIWDSKVYNYNLDWRERTEDHARMTHDYFSPLDGKFKDNVILQVRSGAMDFQVREPVSPLFGAMSETNQIIAFELTDPFTKQQNHLCYLVPAWKESLEFDTYAAGPQSLVKQIISGQFYDRPYGGMVVFSNIGNSQCWTGSPLAQANLYGYGRLAWNPDLSVEQITEEWITGSLGKKPLIQEIVMPILLKSREVYENYTVPLGMSWMINPRLGTPLDRYSGWGIYDYADFRGVGIDRTEATGTGFTTQYEEENASTYESLETCPEELLLFFHHVPYDYRLKNGTTLLQHIYDKHFEAVEELEQFKEDWSYLEGSIHPSLFKKVGKDFELQIKEAKEWRDMVNTYFYKRTGIADEKGRKIYY